MSDLGIRVQGDKAYIIRNGNEKEVPRDAILEIYQSLLGYLSPNRDYSAVTSVKKLLKIIELECEPDDSDDESEKKLVKEVAKPAAARKPAARTIRKTAPAVVKASSDDENDEDEDEDED